MAEIEDAIQYTKEHIRWSEEEVRAGIKVQKEQLYYIGDVCPNIKREIRRLMNEYGVAHGFEEDWFYNFFSEDDIFYELTCDKW